MHIPDGMISPSTAIVADVAMVPVWLISGARLRRTLGPSQVPLLGVCAAFCFTVMMFNVPALGGTTAHAVGATLVAILLGPWAAVIAVTAALVIQALFFADGGLLAIGANSFTMGFVEPLLGYAVYRLLAGGTGRSHGRTAISAGVAAYVGIVAASFVVALLLGVQPALFHTAAGQALYFPFGLKVTIGGIVPTHMLMAGPVEAVVTAAALRFAMANGLRLYATEDAAPETAASLRKHRIGIAFLALLALSPLGLLAQGDAWGEWDSKEVKERVGYVPAGIERQEQSGWKGLGVLADYGSERGPLFYILSACVGAGALVGAFWLLGRGVSRRRKNELTASAHTPDADDETKRPPPGTPSGGSRGGLPEWLVTTPLHDPPPDGKSRRTTSFVEKSMVEMAESAQLVIFGERWARENGLLQRLDPRAKAAALIGLAVIAGWLHAWVGLAIFCAVAMALAGASRLPLGGYLKRVWLTVPVFVGIVALPATLNIVTRGLPVLVICRTPYLAVTREGLGVAGMLVARAGVALSFALLLTMTTRWHELLRALRALGVPKVFVLVLSITYRYIELLLRSAAEMLVARRSRTVGRGTNREGRRYVGHAFGALFGRSLRLADDVNAAMSSRGFSGDVRTAVAPRLKSPDWMLVSGMVLLAVLAVGIERMS